MEQVSATRGYRSPFLQLGNGKLIVVSPPRSFLPSSHLGVSMPMAKAYRAHIILATKEHFDWTDTWEHVFPGSEVRRFAVKKCRDRTPLLPYISRDPYTDDLVIEASFDDIMNIYMRM